MLAIADSSALVALMKDDDATHGQALMVVTPLMKAHAEIIVPSEVFAETINILGKKVSNEVAVRAARKLLSAGFAIVGSEPVILQGATDILASQKNSTSFVDALVMAWANHYKTRNIFGFDAVFKANGYLLPGFG